MMVGVTDPEPMDEPSDTEAPKTTVTEALAKPVATGHRDAPWVDGLLELGALDRAVYQTVGATPTMHLDGPLRRLSRSADAALLWVVIAGAVAAARGERGRRVAGEGIASLAVTAAVVNLGAKSVFRRRRPDRTAHDRTAARRVANPSSPSFPSGHSATSFAFAYTIGRHLPFIGIPIRLLAAAVAYSRVHIGVHYPGDVIVGSVMGAGTAAAVGAWWDRRSGLTS